MELTTNSPVRSIGVYHTDAASNEFSEAYSMGEPVRSDIDCRPLLERAKLETVPVIDSTESGAALIAWPCFRANDCRGVVMFECDGSEESRGAFEVWRRNDRGELGLSHGWYANLERLEQVSKYIKFPRRAGLPGKTWDDRFPRVLGRLSESKDFIRVAAARSERLSSAISVPFMRRPPELDAVTLVLSASSSPFARAIEVWAKEPEGEGLRIVSADYGQLVDLAPISRPMKLSVGDGIAGRVFDEAAPWMTHDLLGVEFQRGKRLVEYGLTIGLGVPVFIGSELVACVNLYL